VSEEPSWLEKRDVLAIHQELLLAFGGRPGLRDEGLLESALGSPKNHFAYGERDLFRLAGAYAYALTRDHPFVDGNKRIAFLAAYVFLGVNGYKLEAEEDDVVRTMLSLARGTLTVEEVIEWLRGRSARRKGGPRKGKRP
jgi:death-on-curing protein